MSTQIQPRKELIEEIKGKAIWFTNITTKWNEKFVDFIDIRLKKEDWDKLKEKK